MRPIVPISLLCVAFVFDLDFVSDPISDLVFDFVFYLFYGLVDCVSFPNSIPTLVSRSF